jgi:rhomboid protease GluP
VTVFLVVLLFAIYLVELGVVRQGPTPEVLFSSPSLATMVAMGAQVGSLVLEGQWWRILTAMFLHFNWLHIATNAYSLYVVGGLIEPYYGSWRYVAVYLLSGIMGGLFLLAFMPPDVVGAGASGAIFGLLGATVVLGLMLPGAARRSLIRWSFTIFALNIAFDLFNPEIGVWDHVGGFIGGLLAAWGTGLAERRPRLGTAGWVLYAALALGIVGRLR